MIKILQKIDGFLALSMLLDDVFKSVNNIRLEK